MIKQRTWYCDKPTTKDTDASASSEDRAEVASPVTESPPSGFM